MSKKIKKVVSKKPPKSEESEELHLELCGGIFLVEKFKGGLERRDEIDGEVVLKTVLQAIMSGLDLMATEDKLDDT